MPLDVHIHPDLSKLPKFSFKSPSKNTSDDSSSKDNFDGNKSDEKTESKTIEESNPALETAMKIGIVVVVFAVTIPVAKWFFKQSADMVREARGLGKALTGK